MQRALEWARRAERLDPDDMAVIINGALVRAHLGMKDEALDMLERVFDKGWGKKEWIEQRSGLRPVARRSALQGDDGEALQ